MDVGIGLGIVGLVWTGIVAWAFYRLAERKSVTRHREDTTTVSEHEHTRRKDSEQHARLQQLQIDFQRRKSARDKFEKRNEHWDAHVEKNGKAIRIINRSDVMFIGVEVFLYEHHSTEGKPLCMVMIWHESSFTLVYCVDDNSSFDNAEKIVITGVVDDSYREMSVEIPLDPTETMPDYRAA